MANQLPTGPMKQLARGAGYKVTNYLTLSIALVTLITVAYATSIPQQQPQQQRLSLSHASHSHLALKRSPPSAFENFEPLYERPRTYSNAAAIANQRDPAAPADEVQDFDAADEEFLRQLKEAARYLDDKLAERQRQQQQLAILNQAPSFGNRLPESAAGRQQQLANSYGYQEPTYGVLEEQRRPVVDLQTNSPYASSWRTFNEPDSDETDAGDLEGDETNVVVVAPGHGNSQLISSSPSQVSDYKLLDEQNQQQQLSNTDAKYKQLLKSLLLDQAQANSLASLGSSENQKRDSINEPAKRDDDDNDRAGTDEEKQQQQSDSTSTSAKYTTLLEDEQDNGKLPATILKDDEAAAKANAPTTASYGTLVYDQAAQRPAVTNSTSPLSSGGSIFGRLYSNVAHYLPFLSQLTSLRLGGNTAATNNSTKTNATTTKPAEATAGLNQAGVPTGSGEKKDGQQQTGDNEPLHAKTNVSVSMTLNKSKLEAADHTTTGGGVVSGNNGETNKQKQRDNDDDVGADDDDANQDNQQSQNNDKQRKQGKMNVKVTIDRKKTNDDEEDDNNNIGGNHDDGNLVDDNFTGQFANNDDELGVRHQDTKSGGLKRDQASQFVFGENDNNNPAELDMNQMVPATIGLGQQGYAVENNNNDDDAEEVPSDRVTSNRYNMMKHSSLMVPIGEASDVLVRTTSGGASKTPDSLLGKYIYAPTQHYYLNSVMPAVGGGGPYSQHHVLSSNGKHIQPGDDIYGSYGSGHMPMKAAYAYHGDRNSIGDKSSDLYFVVMVGAFCVMAMAVVLAAGLFAYRIQQNRKSSQDTDYPTYGVVGPNNMSAKCGAASFVGGYFTGPPSGSSKSGSVKHLPDLYATPNGAGGSDSGLNSLGKSSSNKKASSVSSLNEHNQSTAGRAASSNFMAAASQDAARMYHYQHQKQQMIISDRSSGGRQTSASDLDSEDENDDGSYTVYECPGLASAHEMEIKNPLFNDDQSP